MNRLSHVVTILTIAALSSILCTKEKKKESGKGREKEKMARREKEKVLYFC